MIEISHYLFYKIIRLTNVINFTNAKINPLPISTKVNAESRPINCNNYKKLNQLS